MKHISSLFSNVPRETPKKVKRAPNSERALWVERYMEFLGESNFGKILGQTKHIKPNRMHELYDTADKWRDKDRALMPLDARRAFLWKLVKAEPRNKTIDSPSNSM